MIEDAKSKTESWMKADFLPIVSRTNPNNALDRQAEAAEYLAYQVGQIDKKLGDLIEAVTLMATKI